MSRTITCLNKQPLDFIEGDFHVFVKMLSFHAQLLCDGANCLMHRCSLHTLDLVFRCAAWLKSCFELEKPQPKHWQINKIMPNNFTNCKYETACKSYIWNYLFEVEVAREVITQLICMSLSGDSGRMKNFTCFST